LLTSSYTLQKASTPRLRCAAALGNDEFDVRFLNYDWNPNCHYASKEQSAAALTQADAIGRGSNNRMYGKLLIFIAKCEKYSIEIPLVNDCYIGHIM